MVQLKVASMFFFSGLAVVIALVVVVYVVAWIYDRVSGSAEAPLTTTELEERRVASMLVKDAGLAGLLLDEKNKVMRHFFQGHSKFYDKQHDIETPPDRLQVDRDGAYDEKNPSESKTTKVDTSAVANSNSENPTRKDVSSCKKSDAESNFCNYEKGDKVGSKQKCKAGSSCSRCEDSNDLDQASKSKQSIAGTSEVSDKNRKAEPGEEGKDFDDAGKDAEDGVCPICLVEFENGENVIIGSSCGHIFHFECFMQWVEKNHIDCPLCRLDMMTVENFLASAYEVLGEERVNKLKHMNEEAARRLATLEANYREGTREELESFHDEQASSEPVDTPVGRDPPARLAPTATADTSMLTVVMVQ